MESYRIQNDDAAYIIKNAATYNVEGAKVKGTTEESTPKKRSVNLEKMEDLEATNERELIVSVIKVIPVKQKNQT